LSLARVFRFFDDMGTRGRYSIMLFRGGGEGVGVESVLDSADLIDAAWALYDRAIMKHPGRW
jgi:hypothetical protein